MCYGSSVWARLPDEYRSVRGTRVVRAVILHIADNNSEIRSLWALRGPNSGAQFLLEFRAYFPTVTHRKFRPPALRVTVVQVRCPALRVTRTFGRNGTVSVRASVLVNYCWPLAPCALIMAEQFWRLSRQPPVFSS